MGKVPNETFVRKIVVLLFLLFIVLFKPLSHAQALTTNTYDVKSWGGANCQAYYGAQEADFDKRVNGIYNRSDQYRLASCGIVQDKFVLFLRIVEHIVFQFTLLLLPQIELHVICVKPRMMGVVFRLEVTLLTGQAGYY